MAAKIAVVEETDMPAEAQGSALSGIFPERPIPAPAIGFPMAGAASSAPPTLPQIDPRIIQAFAKGEARIIALESVIGSVPKAATVIRALLAALGVRVAMFFALAGALGLAVPAVLWPDWQRLLTLGGYAVLVYLPLAALAYFHRGN